jgi:hypothetical protein
LSTLPRFLDACSDLLSAVLAIPPYLTSLRAEYSLRLTGDVSDGMLGYEPTPDEIQELFGFLDKLDLAWIAVLSGLGWDGERPVQVELEGVARGRGVGQTERVRLQNLIVRIREAVKQLRKEGAEEDWSEAPTPSDTIAMTAVDMDDDDESDADEMEMEEVDVERESTRVPERHTAASGTSRMDESEAEAEDEQAVRVFGRTLAMLTEVV